MRGVVGGGFEQNQQGGAEVGGHIAVLHGFQEGLPLGLASRGGGGGLGVIEVVLYQRLNLGIAGEDRRQGGVVCFRLRNEIAIPVRIGRGGRRLRAAVQNEERRPEPARPRGRASQGGAARGFGFRCAGGMGGGIHGRVHGGVVARAPEEVSAGSARGAQFLPRPRRPFHISPLQHGAIIRACCVRCLLPALRCGSRRSPWG